MNPDFANKGRHRTTQHLQLQSLLVDSVDMAPYAAKSAVNQDLGSQRRFLCLVHHRFSASQLPGPLLPLRHGSSEAMQAPLPMCGTQSMRDGRSSSKASHASGPPGSKAEDPWFFSLVILGVSAPASFGVPFHHCLSRQWSASASWALCFTWRWCRTICGPAQRAEKLRVPFVCFSCCVAEAVCAACAGLMWLVDEDLEISEHGIHSLRI